MKEYRQVLAAVELVGDWNSRVRTSLQTEGCGAQRPPVKQPKPRYRRSAAMAKRRTWVNGAVCPCLHLSLTHHRNIENKVWEIYFCKELCSFVHWSSSLSLFMLLAGSMRLYNKKRLVSLEQPTREKEKKKSEFKTWGVLGESVSYWLLLLSLD